MSEERHELKVPLDAYRLDYVQSWLSRHVSLSDEREPSMVNSLYFDTPTLSAAAHNLAGLSVRAKPRLRWYEAKDPSQITQPILEIKQRNGRLGSKVRFPAALEVAELITAAREYNQITPYVEALLKTHRPELVAFTQPTLLVQYQRQYLHTPEGVRVTLDTSIRFCDASPFERVFGGPRHDYATPVLELKFTPELTDCAQHLLQSLNLRPRRHSKYVAGLAEFGKVNYW